MAVRIEAPWDKDTVDGLNLWQSLRSAHPYTCMNNHPEGNELVATEQGFHCPHCNYKQFWAYLPSPVKGT